MIEEAKAFRYLNLSVFLQFLGRQIYNIFLPVLMIQNGYGLNWVLLFLILSSAVTILSSYIGQHLMQGKNVLYFNLASVISQLILLTLLNFSGFSKIIFTAIFLLEGFYYSFYYLYYWSTTTYYTSEQTTGRNLGNLTITVALASIIGPLLGSVVLEGSQILLTGIAGTSLILSLIPLLKISTPKVENKESSKIDWKDIKKELIDYSIMSSFGVSVFVLWGIFAYLNDFRLIEIGAIVVATSVARILISSTIKNRLTDRNTRQKIMQISALGIITTSIYRYFSPEQILITNTVMSLFFVGFQLGAQTSIINSLKGGKTYYSSMLLQTNTFITRIIIYAITFFIGLKTTILLPVITGLLYLIMSYFREE